MKGVTSIKTINDFYPTVSKELTRLCFSLCRNTHDADDLFQETWLKAVKSFDRFDKTGDFKKWVFAICVNCYKDMYKARVKSCEIAFDSREHMELFFEMLPDMSDSQKSDYEALYAAINVLPLKYRQVISLRYFSDLDDRAVAEVLHISYAAARKRVSRALKLLQNTMNGETKNV